MRFAVVSDDKQGGPAAVRTVSIRFEVRGGFRRDVAGAGWIAEVGFNPL